MPSRFSKGLCQHISPSSLPLTFQQESFQVSKQQETEQKKKIDRESQKQSDGAKKEVGDEKLLLRLSIANASQTASSPLLPPKTTSKPLGSNPLPSQPNPLTELQKFAVKNHYIKNICFFSSGKIMLTQDLQKPEKQGQKNQPSSKNIFSPLPPLSSPRLPLQRKQHPLLQRQNSSLHKLQWALGKKENAMGDALTKQTKTNPDKMKTFNGVAGKSHRPLVDEMGLEDNLMLHIKNLLQSMLSQLQSTTGKREISYPASKSTSKNMEGVEALHQSKPDTPSNRQASYHPKTAKEREQLGKQEMLIKQILHLPPLSGPREISYPASKSTNKNMEGVEAPPQSKPDTPSNQQASYQPKTVKEREQLGKQEMLIKQILHLPPLSGPREISYPASKSTNKSMEGVEAPHQSKPDTPSNVQASYHPKTGKEREQLGKQEMLIKQILHLPPLSGPREISYHPNRPHPMKSRFPNKDSVTMEIGGDMKKTDKNAYWQSSSEQANKTTTPPLTFQSSQSSEKRRSKIYSGTRARALDWLPTVGVIEEGLLVVSSMYKNGWTLAPLITKLVGQLLFGKGMESTTFLAGKKQPLKVAGNNSQQARNHTADCSISPSQVIARGDGDPLRHEGRNTRKWGKWVDRELDIATILDRLQPTSKKINPNSTNTHLDNGHLEKKKMADGGGAAHKKPIGHSPEAHRNAVKNIAKNRKKIRQYSPSDSSCLYYPFY